MKIIRIDEYRFHNSEMTALNYLMDIENVEVVEYYHSKENKCVFALIDGEIDSEDINIEAVKKYPSIGEWKELVRLLKS